MSDDITLARLSSLLQEAIALQQQQQDNLRAIVACAEQTVSLLAESAKADRFFDSPAAEQLTGFDARQLKRYRENGTFKQGVHYRDVRSAGAVKGDYQYNPAAINRLFRQPAEKRA